jgi:hypothetical protein
MPSSSAKQHRFMQTVAHSPSFAKKAGVSQSVGKDFSAADKGKTFNKGGTMKKGKRFNGEDGASEVEYYDYDPDKTYSGLFTDDDTGELAENTPTRAYKPEKRETEATPARAVSAPAAAPAASKAAPKADPEADFSDVKSGSSTSRAASTVSSQEAKPEPLSNAEIFALGSAIAGTRAVAAAGLSKLAGKRAGAIGKIIEKFTSKGSKTPPTDALAKIKVPSEKEKLAELASSAAREKAAGAATPRRFASKTDKIQIPARQLSDTVAERAAAVKARAPTGDKDRFAYQTERIQTPTRKLTDTIAERAAAAAERAPTGNNRFAYQTEKIQTPKRTLPDTIAERAAAAAERSKARGGRIVRMASGGSVSAASSRADGIAQRGKTKFRIY